MIAKYISFDITKFLRDYYYFKGIIEDLQSKYDSLDGLKAIDISKEKVQSKPTEFEVEKIAIQRVELSRRIADYRDHIATAESAILRLTEEEQKVVDCFFNPRTRVTYMELGLSRSAAYGIRKEALSQLAFLIIGTENIK